MEVLDDFKSFWRGLGRGGLRNKDSLVRRREDRCSRSRGRVGCTRGCGRWRWRGIFRLFSATVKVRRRGRHQRSGRDWRIWI